MKRHLNYANPRGSRHGGRLMLAAACLGVVTLGASLTGCATWDSSWDSTPGYYIGGGWSGPAYPAPPTAVLPPVSLYPPIGGPIYGPIGAPKPPRPPLVNKPPQSPGIVNPPQKPGQGNTPQKPGQSVGTPTTGQRPGANLPPSGASTPNGGNNDGSRPVNPGRH